MSCLFLLWCKRNLCKVKSLVWMEVFTKLELDVLALPMKLLNWRSIVKERGKGICTLQNCSYGKLQTYKIGLPVPVLWKDWCSFQKSMKKALIWTKVTHAYSLETQDVFQRFGNPVYSFCCRYLNCVLVFVYCIFFIRPSFWC